MHKFCTRKYYFCFKKVDYSRVQWIRIFLKIKILHSGNIDLTGRKYCWYEKIIYTHYTNWCRKFFPWLMVIIYRYLIFYPVKTHYSTEELFLMPWILFFYHHSFNLRCMKLKYRELALYIPYDLFFLLFRKIITEKIYRRHTDWHRKKDKRNRVQMDFCTDHNFWWLNYASKREKLNKKVVGSEKIRNLLIVPHNLKIFKINARNHIFWIIACRFRKTDPNCIKFFFRYSLRKLSF